jgi:hypothetical protein
MTDEPRTPLTIEEALHEAAYDGGNGEAVVSLDDALVILADADQAAALAATPDATPERDPIQEAYDREVDRLGIRPDATPTEDAEAYPAPTTEADR